MQDIYYRQNGFTLIELLLYVAIVGTLLMGVSLFFATVGDARIKNQSISEVNKQGELAMDMITQTIRNADSVTVPAAGTSGAALTLAVPTGILSPTIFNLSGSSALQIKEGTGAVIPIINDDVTVSGLTFTNLTRSGTPGVVQVSFTLARLNAYGRSQYDFQKTFTSSAAVRQ